MVWIEFLQDQGCSVGQCLRSLMASSYPGRTLLIASGQPWRNNWLFISPLSWFLCVFSLNIVALKPRMNHMEMWLTISMLTLPWAAI